VFSVLEKISPMIETVGLCCLHYKQLERITDELSGKSG
jgi:hypothetical protein